MGYEQTIVEQRETPVRYRFTVRDFLLLDEIGSFNNQRTELIDGEILQLSPIHQAHSLAVARLITALTLALKQIGSPLRAFSPVSTIVDEHNMPEPDALIASASGDKYVPRDAVKLAAEVALSSLRYDRERKGPLYARAGFPEYWVFDVEAERIIRMTMPGPDGYGAEDEVSIGGPVAAITMPEVIVDTSFLLIQ